MILQVLADKSVSQDTSYLCNQYDNESANILINLPPVFVNENYAYFILCRPPSNTGVNQYSVPLILNVDSLNFIVNSTLSKYKGNWQFCIVIKDNLGALVAVTEYFVGKVKTGIAEQDLLSEQVEDSNLKLLYATDLQSETLRVIAEDERKLNETSRVANESTRENQESTRQQQETIREQQENLRQSTFESNEIVRQNEFNENEQLRVAAENERVEDFGLITTAYETATQENTVVELTSARHDNVNNKNYVNIGARLDKTAEQINSLDAELSSQLAETEKRLDDNAISPDDFIGSDYEKVQQAINYAISNKKAIRLSRLFDVSNDSSLNLGKPSDRWMLRFIGVGGGFKKTNNGFMFDRGNTYSSSSDYSFTNVEFQGVEGSGLILFNGDKIRRLKSNSCIYRDVDTIAKATLYIQSYDFVNDSIVGGLGYSFEVCGAYGLNLTSVLAEHRENFFKQLPVPPEGNPYNRLYRVNVRDSMIEGLSGVAFSIIRTENLVIDGCFFEDNVGGHILFDGSAQIKGAYIGNNRVYQSETADLSAFIVWGGSITTAKTFNNSVNNIPVQDTTLITSGKVMSENDVVNGASKFVDTNDRIIEIENNLNNIASRTELGSIKASYYFPINPTTGVPQLSSIKASYLELPNSSSPSTDLNSLPLQQHLFYWGFVSDKTGYPASYGSVYGFAHSANGYTYSWQVFHGSDASVMYRRYAISGMEWSVWKAVQEV